jgi:hypothetical protein
LLACQALALMRNELMLEVGVRIPRPGYGLGICRELGTAIFAHTKHGEIIFSFDDPKPAFRSLKDGLNRHE